MMVTPPLLLVLVLLRGAGAAAAGVPAGDLTGQCGRPDLSLGELPLPSERFVYGQDCGSEQRQLRDLDQHSTPLLDSFYEPTRATALPTAVAFGVEARATLLHGLNFSQLLAAERDSTRSCRLTRALDRAPSAVGQCAAYLNEGEVWCERLGTALRDARNTTSLAALLHMASELGDAVPASALVAAIAATPVAPAAPAAAITRLLAQAEQTPAHMALNQRGESACLYALAPTHAVGAARQRIYTRLSALIAAQMGFGLISEKTQRTRLLRLAATTPGRFFFTATLGLAAMNHRPATDRRAAGHDDEVTLAWLTTALALVRPRPRDSSQGPSSAPAGGGGEAVCPAWDLCSTEVAIEEAATEAIVPALDLVEQVESTVVVLSLPLSPCLIPLSPSLPLFPAPPPPPPPPLVKSWDRIDGCVHD
eukprot:COSAG05_NODE_2339_length_3212_cov_3.415997_2_plen_422_part_00